MTTRTLTLAHTPAFSQALSRVANPNDGLHKSAQQSYQAWLGFYNGHLRKFNWDKPTLVYQANQFALMMGCQGPPRMEAKTIGKMGLKGVPGLNV